MANLNRIILVGRLTGEPEIKSTFSGLPMTKFRLTVANPDYAQGEPDLIDIVAWSKVAETCTSYLGKGRLVLVEGRIQNRSFDDQTGKRRWVTEVVARSIRNLDGATSAKNSSKTESEVVDDAELSSDLPF